MVIKKKFSSLRLWRITAQKVLKLRITRLISDKDENAFNSLISIIHMMECAMSLYCPFQVKFLCAFGSFIKNWAKILQRILRILQKDSRVKWFFGLIQPIQQKRKDLPFFHVRLLLTPFAIMRILRTHREQTFLSLVFTLCSSQARI